MFMQSFWWEVSDCKCLSCEWIKLGEFIWMNYSAAASSHPSQTILSHEVQNQSSLRLDAMPMTFLRLLSNPTGNYCWKTKLMSIVFKVSLLKSMPHACFIPLCLKSLQQPFQSLISRQSTGLNFVWCKIWIFLVFVASLMQATWPFWVASLELLVVQDLAFDRWNERLDAQLCGEVTRGTRGTRH